MGYSIRRSESIDEAVRRIAAEQLERCRQEVLDEQLDRHLAVHSIRKRCKKMRGLIRFVRPWLGESFADENSFYRELSAELSFVRDTQALIEAFDRLVAESQLIPDDTADEVRRFLGRNQQDIAGDDEQITSKLKTLLDRFHLAEEQVAKWRVAGRGIDAVLPGMMRVYRQCRDRMKHAAKSPSGEAFHDWRKSAKYHWHHTRLLRKTAPRLTGPHRRFARELGELLGQEHDLTVLSEHLQVADGSRAIGDLAVVQEAVIGKQEQLRQEAIKSGRELFAESPGQFADRWREYWLVWKKRAKLREF